MNILSIIWDWDPSLITIGDFDIRWYGLMWAIAILLAERICNYTFKREGLPPQTVESGFIWIVLGTFIGARVGHCLFYEPETYLPEPWRIITDIRNGGLASHGGVFGVIFAAWLYSKKITKQSVWWLFDRIIPSVAVLCFCIRFGNLMNSEIFGFPTDLPWGFEFVRSREWHQLYEGQACHPTQIYEMLYCLAAGVVSLVMYHKFHLLAHR